MQAEGDGQMDKQMGQLQKSQQQIHLAVRLYTTLWCLYTCTCAFEGAGQMEGWRKAQEHSWREATQAWAWLSLSQLFPLFTPFSDFSLAGSCASLPPHHTFSLRVASPIDIWSCKKECACAHMAFYVSAWALDASLVFRSPHFFVFVFSLCVFLSGTIEVDFFFCYLIVSWCFSFVVQCRPLHVWGQHNYVFATKLSKKLWDWEFEVEANFNSYTNPSVFPTVSAMVSSRMSSVVFPQHTHCILRGMLKW